MQFTLIEGGDKDRILDKLNKFAKEYDVKTVAFAMWGKPLLYIGYEEYADEEIVEDEGLFE